MKSTPQTQAVNNRQIIAQMKHHQTLDLRGLLLPWLSFKLWIQFKPSAEYRTSTSATRTMYGDEHSCTYSQCLNRWVDHILLDRIKGYNALIDLIERGNFKGTYLNAKLYGKDDSGQWSILHRHYRNGKLDVERLADPVIDSDKQFRKLFFTVESNKLVISETPFNGAPVVPAAQGTS